MTYSATGRRKTSIAQVRIKEGKGRITINGRNFEDFFPTIPLQNRLLQPFQVVGMVNKWDVDADIRGGGITGQLDAMRLGISRALLKTEPADLLASPSLASPEAVRVDSTSSEGAAEGSEGEEEVEAPKSLRQQLKDAGLLTRDSRAKERKKAGQPKARKRFQFSKR